MSQTTADKIISEENFESFVQEIVYLALTVPEATQRLFQHFNSLVSEPPCNCDHCKLMREVESRPPGIAFASGVSEPVVMNKDKILAEIAELFEPKWGYNTKEQWLKLVADILTAHEQEGMNQTTADKIIAKLTRELNPNWIIPDNILVEEMASFINSLVSEPALVETGVIAPNGIKEMVEEYDPHEVEKPIKTNEETI